MYHEMNLQDRPFEFIKNGTKRIELRLLDEKRSQIKVGDIIDFNKGIERTEHLKTKVVDLIKYNTFEELMNDYDVELLADKSVTKKELLEELEKYYSKEKQKEYGVVGIKIELCK